MGLFDFLTKPKVEGIIKFLCLEDWYNSLSSEEQKKLKEYSRWGEDLIRGKISHSFQTQKHFFWTSAINANFYNDLKFAIFLAEKGKNSQGTLVDQHFIYNAFIKAYEKQKDYKNAKKICLHELEEFPLIGNALKEDFNGKLPSGIPCRDTLIYIDTIIETDYEECEKDFNLLIKNDLVSQEEAQNELQNFKITRMYNEAEKLLKKKDLKEAKAIFNEIIDIDKSRAAEIYKMLGNYLLEINEEQEALEYFQKSISINPLITGVKSKLSKLSEKFGINIKSNNEDILNILQKKEKETCKWWQKRDLANEYIKIKHYDHAWSLYNEAISIRTEEGGHCDTIYSQMAKMLEKENRHSDALFHYLLAYRELLLKSGNEPPKYVSQGIDRCLKKLGSKNLNHKNLYKLMAEETEPEKIRKSLVVLLEQE